MRISGIGCGTNSHSRSGQHGSNESAGALHFAGDAVRFLGRNPTNFAGSQPVAVISFASAGDSSKPKCTLLCDASHLSTKFNSPMLIPLTYQLSHMRQLAYIRLFGKSYTSIN